MKKLLVNMVAGVGLFAGTLAGLLAATGRLNHDGARDIPLIGAFFPPPPGTGKPGEEGKGEEGKTEPGKTDAAAGAPAEAGKPQEPGVLRRGRSLFEESDKAGAGGSSAAPGTETKGKEPPPKDKPAPNVANASAAGKQPEKDFQGLEQQLAADRKNPYQPGSYFRFEGLPSGISADKLNEAWQRVQQELGELDKRKASQDQREQDLLTLEQDLSRRQVEVGRERTRIETLQKELDARIELFHQQVKMVRLDEVTALKKNATTLASFEPSKAAELVQEQWKSEAGQDLVLKTLEVMDKDAANGILAALPNGLIRDVLERRLRLVREQPTGTGK